MTDTSTIVVGFDGSAAAERAVVWAARTAAGRGHDLRIVIAVDVPGTLDSDQTAEFRAVAGSRLAAAEVLATESCEGLRLVITAQALEGNVVDVLVEESAHAAMVVVGESGTNGPEAGRLGSSSNALCAHATSPVTVVRGRSIDGLPPTLGPVVVGVDGSAANQYAVAAAFEEASLRDASLIAVHVWSDVSLSALPTVSRRWEDIAASEEALLAESLAGFAQKFPDVEVRRLVAQDRPVRVIGQLSEQASLVVVGNRGRGGFKGMLLGSTSYALIHTADCPVLVVRGQTATVSRNATSSMASTL